MPTHYAINFFLSFLELLRMKNYGKKKSVYGGYCLSRGVYQYRTNEFSEDSHRILCRCGEEGEWVVTPWSITTWSGRRYESLPANSVPADPLISSSSSGAIEPSASRWESNNVEVYDGRALPDIYGKQNENLLRHTYFHSYTDHVGFDLFKWDIHHGFDGLPCLQSFYLERWKRRPRGYVSSKLVLKWGLTVQRVTFYLTLRRGKNQPSWQRGTPIPLSKFQHVPLWKGGFKIINWAQYKRKKWPT